jgi:CheY-like chemotaxis protein
MKKNEKQYQILLVEDDYLDVVSVKRSLSKIKVNYNLHVAHNGADALEALTAENSNKFLPDIILLDMNMPKMNGLEFLRIIKNYYSLSSIKVFVMTTSGEDYDKLAAISLGVTGYIIKPLNFDSDDADTKILKELLTS